MCSILIFVSNPTAFLMEIGEYQQCGRLREFDCWTVRDYGFLYTYERRRGNLVCSCSLPGMGHTQDAPMETWTVAIPRSRQPAL